MGSAILVDTSHTIAITRTDRFEVNLTRPRASGRGRVESIFMTAVVLYGLLIGRIMARLVRKDFMVRLCFGKSKSWFFKMLRDAR